MQSTTNSTSKGKSAGTDSRRALRGHWLPQVEPLQKPRLLRLNDTFWWWAGNSVSFMTMSPRETKEQHSQRLGPFRVSSSGLRTLSLSHTLLGAPPRSERGARIHRLIELGIRGVMEILGLDWSLPIQSQTQYLEGIFRVSWSGDKVDTCCRLVSTLYPLSPISPLKWIQTGDEEETCLLFKTTYRQ
jgi:hypothetical protein